MIVERSHNRVSIGNDEWYCAEPDDEPGHSESDESNVREKRYRVSDLISVHFPLVESVQDGELRNDATLKFAHQIKKTDSERSGYVVSAFDSTP